MQVTRIYSGDDGKSHLEQLDVPLADIRYGSLSELVPVAGVAFRETPVNGFLDFHRAPRRQFVILLSGGEEIECGDGSKCRLGPGSIILADDTTGEGHITREFGEPGRSIFLPVPEDFDVAAWRKEDNKS